MLTRLLLVCLLLAPSALADSPIVSERWEASGFEPASPEEAELTVAVTYSVPGVIKDTDTHHFKRGWSHITEYADGSTGMSRQGETSFVGKCRDGTEGGCNGAANVRVGDAGPVVTLHLAWSGKASGELKREFLVPWSELDKVVKDEKAEIRVTVRYGPA